MLQWLWPGFITILRSPIDSQPSGLGAERRKMQTKCWQGNDVIFLELSRNKPYKLSAGKVMTLIFWNYQGINLIDYLEKGHTINVDGAFEGRNRKKRPLLKKKKVLFHQDDAVNVNVNVNVKWCHKSVKTIAKIHELGYELLPHPS